MNNSFRLVWEHRRESDAGAEAALGAGIAALRDLQGKLLAGGQTQSAVALGETVEGLAGLHADRLRRASSAFHNNYRRSCRTSARYSHQQRTSVSSAAWPRRSAAGAGADEGSGGGADEGSASASVLSASARGPRAPLRGTLLGSMLQRMTSGSGLGSRRGTAAHQPSVTTTHPADLLLASKVAQTSQGSIGSPQAVAAGPNAPSQSYHPDPHRPPLSPLSERLSAWISDSRLGPAPVRLQRPPPAGAPAAAVQELPLARVRHRSTKSEVSTGCGGGGGGCGSCLSVSSSGASCDEAGSESGGLASSGSASSGSACSGSACSGSGAIQLDSAATEVQVAVQVEVEAAPADATEHAVAAVATPAPAAGDDGDGEHDAPDDDDSDDGPLLDEATILQVAGQQAVIDTVSTLAVAQQELACRLNIELPRAAARHEAYSAQQTALSEQLQSLAAQVSALTKAVQGGTAGPVPLSPATRKVRRALRRGVKAGEHVSDRL